MPVEEQMLHDYKCLIFVSSPLFSIISSPSQLFISCSYSYCTASNIKQGGRGWKQYWEGEAGNVAGRESVGM